MLQYADRPARVLTLARALFWSSVVVAGYGVLQYVGWDPVRWGVSSFEANRAFSTFGNPDLLGGFLVFSVPVALALALAERRTWHRLVYWAGFAAQRGVPARVVHPWRVDRRGAERRPRRRHRLAT